jgi:phosphatidylserine/phosphatidylglycerophosphate/cardiolipin synthase-like enzyme
MSSSSAPLQNSFDSYEPKQELESPFLNEEYLAEEARISQWRVPVPGVQLESPFLAAFEDGWRSGEVEEFDELEEEFDGEDELFELYEPVPVRDYSLKEIAEGTHGKVPSGILADIMTNGNFDANALTYQVFWQQHPDLNGMMLDEKNRKHREWRTILDNQIKPLIWLRGIVELLDKYRGDIPREFLLGWMAEESDGRVNAITSRPERGYFQIDWKTGESQEQLKLSAKDFRRLSTDREYSIQMGVELAQIYRRHFLKLYKLTDGSELLWRLTKARHAVPSPTKLALNKLVKEGKDIKDITWLAISQTMSDIKYGPTVVNNVNKVFRYALLLKPIADLIPLSPVPTPEMFTPSFEERWEAIDKTEYNEILDEEYEEEFEDEAIADYPTYEVDQLESEVFNKFLDESDEEKFKKEELFDDLAAGEFLDSEEVDDEFNLAGEWETIEQYESEEFSEFEDEPLIELHESPSQYTNPYFNPEYYGDAELGGWDSPVSQQQIRQIDMNPLEISSRFPFKAMGGEKVRAGNQVDFLIDGSKTFEAMAKAIRTATGNQHYIYLLGWWLTDCFPLIINDSTSTIAQMFADAARKGVQIRVMLWDQFGRKNSPEIRRINALPGGGAILDNETLRYGSHHQKVLVVKGNKGLIGFCGGIDLNPDRIVSNPKRDFPGCSTTKPDNISTTKNLVIASSGVVSNDVGATPGRPLPDIPGRPMHDIHCQVCGPAAHDLLLTFIQRWQAHPKHKKIDSAKGILRGLTESIPANVGKQFVRIAHTFNLVTSSKCQKARSVRSTTIAAIQFARKFIYIEDQYLVSMRAATELRKALPKIKHLTIVMPHSSITVLPQVWRRRKAFIDFLKAGPDAHKVRVFFLINPTSGGFGPFTYVHSKTWIIDDEIAIIGSANCNRRGWSYDSEVNAVIYDGSPAQNSPLPFAQRLRVALWSKYLNIAPHLIIDGIASATEWLKPSSGAWIRPYNQNEAKDPGYQSAKAERLWNSVIDPSADTLPACQGGIDTKVELPIYVANSLSHNRTSKS